MTIDQDAQYSRASLVHRKREETQGYLDNETVDQEVGGSNPPSCTSAWFYHAEGDMTRFRVAKRLAVAALSSLVIAGTVGSAYAQEKYPTRPITFIVPFAAGGPTDILARLIGQSVGLTLGQQVVVEDVTGAGGTIWGTRAARAHPHGYTLVIGTPRTPSPRPSLSSN